ncbi:large conductance mechanosensitive channel [Chitinophaga costaii]|uniref:Large-conductance mechanosensitive channel n=1 Tax=Chitinophaga costaii TaxID=1335309 RepID=A0A1C4DRW9_9BACT|nr:large conductance mechanosensitive channel protein MscL [Chitinophaga costaii]PUZ27764.1 large conductance mechanosensitive channel protein MscL [Chitinophaga costaii]SCC34138.1 large conductance mechanosensitive channel [Chitinophaga costaii]
MSFFKEFRDFAMKGNVIDLAVGVIIGAAFSAIVTSLVENIIMPIIGLFTKGTDFTNLFITLNDPQGREFKTLAEAKAAGVAVFGYGAFLQAVFQFLIIAFSIFLMVKAINSLHRKKTEDPAAPAAPTAEEQLLIEIRDAIKAK